MDKDKLKYTVVLLLIFIGCMSLMFLMSRNYWMNELENRDGVKLEPNEELLASETETSTKVDTVHVHHYHNDIKTFTHDSTILVPAVVDTAGIIAKYFTKRFESYELKDSNLVMNAFYSVFKNSVSFDSIKYQLIKKTIETKTTNVVGVTRPRLGVGMFANVNRQNLYSFGPAINLSTKKLNVGAGYDVLSKSIHVSVCANINRR